MMIVLIGFGVLLGIATALAAVMAGQSILTAVILYAAVGTVFVLAVVLVLLLLAAIGDRAAQAGHFQEE